MKTASNSTCFAVEYRRAEASVPERVIVRDGGREYPWHFHVRHWCLGVIQEGTVFLQDTSGSVLLRAGDVFAVAPLALHRLRTGAQSRLYLFCLPEQRFLLQEREGEFPAGTPAEFFRFAMGALNNSQLLPVPDQRQAAESREEKARRAPSGEGTDGSRLAALPGVNGFARLTRAPAPGSGRMAAALKRLLQSLQEQPDVPLSLYRLASLAGYSPWHFLRLFRHMTGTTPYAFQLLYRVSRVRALLQAGMGAADAALEAGFTDQSHMHKLFKRHHGLTPGQFMQACSGPPGR